VKDPEPYLTAQKIRIPDGSDRKRGARIEPAFRAYVNHEIFFFADSISRDRFLKEPLRYCGRVTDPVSGQRFKPTTGSPRLNHQGRPYFFRDRYTLETFSAMPDSFAHRRGA